MGGFISYEWLKGISKEIETVKTKILAVSKNDWSISLGYYAELKKNDLFKYPLALTFYEVSSITVVLVKK